MMWVETLSFADGYGIAELCIALPESLSLQLWIKQCYKSSFFGLNELNGGGIFQSNTYDKQNGNIYSLRNFIQSISFF